jgi:Uma2 family endonuclease
MTVHVRHDATLPGTPVARRRFTVAEFHRMGEAGVFGPDERVELLAGEVHAMSPAGRFHEVLRLYLSQFWSRRVAADLLIAQEMQLRLSDDYEPVIDIGVLPMAILPPDARGPDMLLVVEIADSSWAVDTEIKRDAYARAGVREYWVIQALTRATRVHRDLQADGMYRTVFEVAATDIVTPLLVPYLAVRLADLPSAA